MNYEENLKNIYKKYISPFIRDYFIAHRGMWCYNKIKKLYCWDYTDNFSCF